MAVKFTTIASSLIFILAILQGLDRSSSQATGNDCSGWCKIKCQQYSQVVPQGPGNTNACDSGCEKICSSGFQGIGADRYKQWMLPTAPQGGPGFGSMIPKSPSGAGMMPNSPPGSNGFTSFFPTSPPTFTGSDGSLLPPIPTNNGGSSNIAPSTKSSDDSKESTPSKF